MNATQSLPGFTYELMKRHGKNIEIRLSKDGPAERYNIKEVFADGLLLTDDKPDENKREFLVPFDSVNRIQFI